MLKTVVAFLRPRAGRVTFDGEDITGLRPDLVLPRGLAYVPQGRIVFPRMTVLENLEMGGYTVRDPASVAAALERVYGLFPILADRRRQKTGSMSGGGAADGGDRARPHDDAPPHRSRRAVARPRAEVRHADLPEARRDEGRGVHAPEVKRLYLGG